MPNEKRKLEELVDVSKFIIAKPYKKQYEKKIIINEKGEIKMNSTMSKATEERMFTVAYSMDYNRLLLIPNCEQEIRFNKNGVARDVEVVKHLAKIKKLLPIEYIMEWDDKQNIWQGKLENKK